MNNSIFSDIRANINNDSYLHDCIIQYYGNFDFINNLGIENQKINLQMLLFILLKKILYVIHLNHI